jgi:hypothetical protein
MEQLKIPQDAIDRINAIAMEEKKPPTKNPNISIGLETRSVDEVRLEEDLDVLPPTNHETMKPNQEVLEIDPINENADDSSVDSDYVPSDQRGSRFRGRHSCVGRTLKKEDP